MTHEEAIKALQDEASRMVDGIKADLDRDLVRFKATIESMVIRCAAEGVFDAQLIGHSFADGLARVFEKAAKDLRA